MKRKVLRTVLIIIAMITGFMIGSLAYWFITGSKGWLEVFDEKQNSEKVLVLGNLENTTFLI